MHTSCWLPCHGFGGCSGGAPHDTASHRPQAARQPAHLGERALAGAVLAHDGVHLALAHCRQWVASGGPLQRGAAAAAAATLPPAAPPQATPARRAAQSGATAWLLGAASDAHSPVSVTPLRICCPVAAILACRSCTSSSTSPAAARVTRRAAARCTRVARWQRRAAAGRGVPTLQAIVAAHAIVAAANWVRDGGLQSG